MSNWINIDEKWPDPSLSPLILTACPAFDGEGRFEKHSYRVLRFDGVEHWIECLWEEPFDVRAEVAFWQPISDAPDVEKRGSA